MYQPQIYKNTDTLYWPSDNNVHRGNLVTEASPARLRDHVYIASGSGHVWGYNLVTQKIDWEYFIGSDIDGSPVVTHDNCLLISVEKQYIPGQGGLLKLDPSKDPKEALVWYFPTQNRNFASWQGGIIGTAAVNDAYRKEGDKFLAATMAIDGNLYVIEHNVIDTTKKVKLFDGKTEVPTPKLLFKQSVGGSISTPLIVGNKLIATGYDGTFLFEFDEQYNFKLLAKNDVRCEATPFVHNRRIYLASRDGYLYCFGD
jgi:outer membrane protein assembly factor BamB